MTASGGARRYRAASADQAAWARATRPKDASSPATRQLRDTVEEKLQQWSSSQQIAGWLKPTYPSRPERSTRHLMLVGLPDGNHQADAVADALPGAITTLPRRLDLRTVTQADFNAIARALNERPRQTLQFKTPSSQALAEALR